MIFFCVRAQPAADPLPAFRDFVTNEKQRLTQKRQALVKNERDKRMAELLRFSQSFKVRPIPPLSASRPLRLLTSSLSRLAPRAGPAPDPAPQLNKPIPDDLVSILAKDEDKQRQIREKSSRDAASAQARAIGVTSATAALLGPGPGAAPHAHGAAPAVPTSATVKALASAKHAAAAVGASASAGSALGKAGDGAAGKAQQQAVGKSGRISMVIQPIPPFKGPRSGKHGAAGDKAGAGAGAAGSSAASASAGVKSAGASASASAQAQAQAQAHANRLNVNASSFRPNPKAVAFMPVSGPRRVRALVRSC